MTFNDPNNAWFSYTGEVSIGCTASSFPDEKSEPTSFNELKASLAASIFASCGVSFLPFTTGCSAFGLDSCKTSVASEKFLDFKVLEDRVCLSEDMPLKT